MIANDSHALDWRVTKVLALRRENPAISIGQLANALETSVSHLQHLVKQELGVSLREYQRALALDEAAHLLRTTNLKLRFIRKRVGIPDGSNFSHYFRQRFAMSPNVYGRRHQQREGVTELNGQDSVSRLSEANRN